MEQNQPAFAALAQSAGDAPAGDVHSSPLGIPLPRMLDETLVGGVSLSHWILIAALALAGWIAAPALTRLAQRVVRSAPGESAAEAIGLQVLESSRSPLRWCAAVLLLSLGVMRIPEDARMPLQPVLRVAAALSVAWLCASAVTGVAQAVRARAVAAHRPGLIAVIMLAQRLLQVLAFIAGAVAAATSLGFDMTGVIAGLGIGGIAISLAAQRTIENVFAGVTIVADQPVRVGDSCRVGGRTGTVERIGMRSVAIRMLDRTLVTIPNSVFAGSEVESLSARDRMRFHAVFPLRLETSSAQVEAVTERLRRLLADHPRSVKDTISARLISVSAASMDVEARALLATTVEREFEESRERLLLDSMRAIEECGASIASPATTVHISRRPRDGSAEHAGPGAR